MVEPEISSTKITEALQKPTKVHSTKNYLSLTLLSLLTLLLFLAPIIDKPLTQNVVAALKRTFEKSRMVLSLTSDPRIGTPLGKLIATESLTETSATYVVVIGSCADCVQSSVQSWEEATKQNPKARLLLVSRDTKTNIGLFTRKANIKSNMLPDVDGTISRAFNATYIPRAYYFNAEGNLEFLQNDENMPPAEMVARTSNSAGGNQ